MIQGRPSTAAPAAAEPAAPPAAEPAAPERRGKVVVGVDGSSLSLEGLAWAGEIARWRNWTLHVVHAFHVVYPSWPVEGSVGVPDDFEDAVVNAARSAIEKEEAAMLGSGDDLEITHAIVEGPAAQVLISESEGADLLVIGGRGSGGVRSMLLGSVGNTVVHHAPCPVLVMRRPPEA